MEAMEMQQKTVTVTKRRNEQFRVWFYCGFLLTAATNELRWVSWRWERAVKRSDDDDQHITIICTIFSAAERACQARILSATERSSRLAQIGPDYTDFTRNSTNYSAASNEQTLQESEREWNTRVKTTVWKYRWCEVSSDFNWATFTRVVGDVVVLDADADAGDLANVDIGEVCAGRNSVSTKTWSFTKVRVVTDDALLMRSTLMSGSRRRCLTSPLLFELSLRNLRKLKSSCTCRVHDV